MKPSTRTSKLALVGSSIAVRSSSIHGRGVFAVRILESGETLEEGHLLLLDHAENDVPNALADTYSFEFKGEQRCIALGAVSLCNHSQTANAEMFIDQASRTYQLVSQRRIELGEEILLDYGAEYWEELGADAP